MMRIKRNKKGFTLIELLIVVAIIGILAAIAIPAYTGYTAKSKVAGVVHALGSLKTALTAYYTEAGVFPAANISGATAIASALGVYFPTQYINGDTGIQINSTGSATTVSAVATFANINSDVNTKTLTLQTSDGAKSWTWAGGGGLADTFVPK